MLICHYCIPPHHLKHLPIKVSHALVTHDDYLPFFVNDRLHEIAADFDGNGGRKEVGEILLKAVAGIVGAEVGVVGIGGGDGLEGEAAAVELVEIVLVFAADLEAFAHGGIEGDDVLYFIYRTEKGRRPLGR